MKPLDHDKIKKAFGRELTMMNSETFARTYAYMYIFDLMTKKLSWWHRTYVLATHGYPFINRRDVNKKIVNTILSFLSQHGSSDLNGSLIEKMQTQMTYTDIIGATMFINDHTDYKFSPHFVSIMDEFMKNLDDYLEKLENK
jgi:hypothetical protein